MPFKISDCKMFAAHAFAVTNVCSLVTRTGFLVTKRSFDLLQ